MGDVTLIMGEYDFAANPVRKDCESLIYKHKGYSKKKFAFCSARNRFDFICAICTGPRGLRHHV